MFTAGLLQAIGYRAEVTPASGDGGVIAYRDPLGLEPPIIKVQCKRTLNTIGGPDVQKLMGTLAPGSTEVGLFITLGTFTSDTISLARSRHDLRSVNGRQLVDMIFDHYEQLDPEWCRLLPSSASTRWITSLTQADDLPAHDRLLTVGATGWSRRVHSPAAICTAQTRESRPVV